MQTRHMSGIRIRVATADDMDQIFRVRTSVTENLLTFGELERRDITPASVAASFLAQAKGWVAEQADQVVAFAIADRESKSIFALFVLPEFEGRGIGGRLLDLALLWLRQNGAERVWLTTAPQTRAAHFYERRGWVIVGRGTHGDIRYECALSRGRDSDAIAP
jgi:GNAT superfamily N-acetyltransferase